MSKRHISRSTGLKYASLTKLNMLASNYAEFLPNGNFMSTSRSVLRSQHLVEFFEMILTRPSLTSG
jgi:hypothetical protein